MAKHFLDRSQVRTLLQHVRAEGVAQSVRVHIRRKSFRYSNLLHNPSHAPGRQPLPAQIHQQRPFRASCLTHNLLTPWEIRLHRLGRRLPKRHVPLFFTLAAHQDDFVRPPDVI